MEKFKRKIIVATGLALGSLLGITEQVNDHGSMKPPGEPGLKLLSGRARATIIRCLSIRLG